MSYFFSTVKAGRRSLRLVEDLGGDCVDGRSFAAMRFRVGVLIGVLRMGEPGVCPLLFGPSFYSTIGGVD